MSTTAITVTVLAALVSGLAGALLSTWVYVRRENRKFRLSTLKKFAANRYDLKGDEFSQSLNEIFIAFNDSPEVIKSLAKYHRTVTEGEGGEVANDALVDLFKAMCQNAEVSYNNLNDSFFLRPFNTRK
jgi:hypothetical protein